MSQMEISPEIFTADYVGEPGRRSFYLQARSPHGTYSFALEKQQVAVLAEKLRELLLLIDAEDTVKGAASARDPALALQEPVEPEWRVGTMGLAYEESGDRVVVLAQPVEVQEEDEPVEDDEEEGIRILLRRDQGRAFVLHASAIVEEGRPTCQLCGLPMDPSGHACPASNGHRKLS
ncbi:MAG: DUF3090 family protein [Actinomycetota bacterium]|nr:DUF3090 family protein [Actinomycetota bacterium]